jgi:hypothetical protein
VSEATLRRARAKVAEIDRDFPGGGGSRAMWKLKPLVESNGKYALDDETEAWIRGLRDDQ